MKKYGQTASSLHYRIDRTGRRLCSGDARTRGADSASKQSGDQKAKIYSRLRTLDETEQEHIACKYYHGHRPWMATGGSMESGSAGNVSMSSTE